MKVGAVGDYPSRFRGGIFDLFSNLWYNKNEKHFKNEIRRAGRLISYCGSPLSLFSFLTKNEIEAIRANLREIS